MDMSNTKHLGFLIKITRKERKVSQTQLAKLAHTKQPAIARAEKNGCSLKFAEKILGVLDFEITNIALRSKIKSGLQFYN